MAFCGGKRISASGLSTAGGVKLGGRHVAGQYGDQRYPHDHNPSGGKGARVQGGRCFA